MALSDNTIKIVQATAPLVAENALKITTTFYPILFEKYPETKVLFNQSHQKSSTQPEALAGAIIAYASNIDNLGVLLPAVESITERHASLNIRPEHYPMVGDALLTAIAQVLGEAVTPEIGAAWTEAYEFLAALLVDVEKGKYAKTAEQEGGWEGYRSFTLDRKVKESAVVSSFYFKPSDGQGLATFEAGQYISIRINHPTEGVLVRNYSLSDSPSKDYYRLSVKKEEQGLVSQFLHDQLVEGQTVELNPPYGVFKLTTERKAIVLLSAGVGVTPLLSMWNQLSESIPNLGLLGKAINRKGAKVNFLHANISPENHALQDEITSVAKNHPFFDYHFFYDDLTEETAKSSQGRLTKEAILKHAPNITEAEVYICGPAPMMQATYSSLIELGVDAENINYEAFGPSAALSA